MSESVVISKGTDVVNVSISGQGEVNTGQNVGTGAEIFKEKVGADFRYRTVVGGTGLTVVQGADELTLNVDADSHYTNADVDAHLNRTSALPNYLLGWNGSDYVWVFDVGFFAIGLTDLSVTQAAASGTGALSYNNTNGVFTYTPPDLTTGIDTSMVSENGNLYYTDARVSTHLLTMDGSIIPDTDITHDLGSPTKQWRDVYIGPGSLYVNGKKVIEDDAGTITIETDEDQNLRVKTTGVGVTQITSAQAIQLTASNSADIELTTATGQIELNGDVVIDVSKSLTTSSGGTLTVACPISMGTNDLDVNNLTVDGNLTVSGTRTIVNTEEINLADNTILLNSNFVGATPTENSGIEINRGGTLPNKTFIWDEASDRWTLSSETLVAGTVIANVTGQVSDVSNHDTDNIDEGSTNLYYTDTKVQSVINTNTAGYITDYTVTESDVTAHEAALSITESQISDLTHYTDSDATSAISLSSSNLNELSYDTGTGVLTYVSPSTVASTGQVVIDVRNTSGVTIPRGAAVYLAGHSGNKILVALADANAAGEHPAIGLANSAMNNNSDGTVLIAGEMASVDTSAFTVNDVLYVSETAGGLTATRPSSETTAVQNIGKVARSDNQNGIIIVSGSGRENDVPNLDHLHTFIGNVSGVEKRQLTTDDLTEGANLYYTDTRANTAIDARVTKSFVENLDIDVDGGTY